MGDGPTHVEASVAASGTTARAARQWLRTGAMLGVPFHPVRTPAGADAEPPLVEVMPRDAPSATVAAATAASDAPAAPPPPTSASAARSADASADPADDPERILGRLAAAYVETVAPAVTEHPWTNVVFGEGPATARLMVIGEGPGADEDRTGRPFVGRAGHKLEEMLAAMGLARDEVYIANVVKIRPPGNRTPLAAEVARCGPWLRAQIRTVAPEAILALGGPAAHWLLASEQGIGRLRGVWADYADDGAADPVTGLAAGESRSVPVMPTYHPAYVLRSYTREVRERVWHDLQAVMGRLGLERPGSRG